MQLTKHHYIIGSIIVLATVGAVALTFYLVQVHLSLFAPPTNAPRSISPGSKTSPVIRPTSKIAIHYSSDGEVDTAGWQTYQSTYGGFSVRAPKERSGVGCTGKCDPAVNGEPFVYTLTDGFDGPGWEGLSIRIAKKLTGETLANWESKHMTQAATDRITQTPTRVNGYSAIQVSLQAAGVKDIATILDIGYGPVGIFDAPTVEGRFIIVDIGDRFALIDYVLNPDLEDFQQYNDTNLAGRSDLLDEKTRNDVYEAIIASFRAFPPSPSK